MISVKPVVAMITATTKRATYTDGDVRRVQGTPLQPWIRSAGDTSGSQKAALAPGGDAVRGVMRLVRSLIFTDDRRLDRARHHLTLDHSGDHEPTRHHGSTAASGTDHGGYDPPDPPARHRAAQGGPYATPGQVTEAMCADMRNSTIPIETSAYKISALYYGWQFGVDPSQTLLNGGCPTT
jgi:hypothetical protein